ncbi:MAG: hypothetical protein Q9160_009044 [Pyrenula sp. 1 TL-2023]
MKSVFRTISAIALVAGLVQANTDLVTLSTLGSAWIQEVDATVILPQLPNPVTGHNSLWSAIYTDNSKSFMQGVSAVGPGEQVEPDDSTVGPEYVYKRKISLDGFDEYEHDPTDGGDQAADSLYWEDVSIVLSQADMSFKHTGAWASGAAGGVMSTPDAGKTWNFTTLYVPEQKAKQ